MKSDKNIREGYKRTAVGVIPVEWEVKKLDKLVSKVGSGITPRGGSSVYKKTGRPFIRSQNISLGNLLLEDIVFIDDQTHNTFINSELKKLDVLLNITGASIGRSAIVENEIIGGNVNQHVCIIRPKEKLNSKYLNLFLLSSQGQKLIYSYQAGGNREGLNFQQIRSFTLPLPPLPEQQAIANCLTTWDSGIEKLTQLIAAKREQKKGLMQQLLTGKKRLDGFVGEWKEVKIGKLGETFNGLTGKTKKDFGEGKPYVTYLNTFRQNCIDENTSFDYVKINDNENQSTLKYGDLIFTTSSETPNEVGMSSVILFHPKDSLYLNSFCFGLRLENFETLHPSFATFMLRGNDFRREMYKLAQGSTRFNLSKASFKKITVKLPPIEEQTAIAHILTTADKEIELLEKKLEAMKEEKKGLMQVLLTGKKRLIDS